MDENWVPGCVDLFILTLQIILLGHHFFHSIVHKGKEKRMMPIAAFSAIHAVSLAASRLFISPIRMLWFA